MYAREHSDGDLHEIKTEIEKYSTGELVIIQISQEICRDEKYYIRLIDICASSDSDVRLMMSTIDEFAYSTHPYSNIYQWRFETIRDNINSTGVWKHGDFWEDESHRIIDFNKSCLNVKIKKHRGILSVRKETPERRHIFSTNPIVESINDGISRYAQWPADPTEFRESIGFPTIKELKKEYKESYFAFVVETDTLETYRSQLSEKTLLAFMSGCLPIIYGNYEYVKKLQNLGFYIFNDTFKSWKDSPDFTERAESFKQIISEINKLSMIEVKQFWLDNQSKVIHNYNLLKEITQLDSTPLI